MARANASRERVAAGSRLPRPSTEVSSSHAARVGYVSVTSSCGPLIQRDTSLRTKKDVNAAGKLVFLKISF